MFNQKVNGYLSENPEYLNYSYASPRVSSLDIHRCGTTINRVTKTSSCASLPLQSWCSPNVAVESFAMRPIVNPKEYFDILNKYLASIIYTDSINLKQSGLAKEHYYLFNDDSQEPYASFIQAIKSDVTDTLNYYMSASTDNISIFKEYNPLCEGFIVTDVDITTYKSYENPNHFFHRILFSAFNTTRYNTVSFKAEAYQDTTPMMEQWNNAINKVMDSQNVAKNINTNSIVYISLITLLNNSICVTGQEADCEFKGYNVTSPYSQLLNENFLKPPAPIQWERPEAISNDIFNSNGNYDQDGNIRIVDNGPSNIEQLIKSLF